MGREIVVRGVNVSSWNPCPGGGGRTGGTKTGRRFARAGSQGSGQMDLTDEVVEATDHPADLPRFLRAEHL